jgi:hypothetical protein
VRRCEHSEQFVGKSLADGFNAREVKNHCLELLEATREPLCLRPGHQLFTFVLCQAHRNKRRDAEINALATQIEAKDDLLARQQEAFAAERATLMAKVAQLGAGLARSEPDLTQQQGGRGVHERLVSANPESSPTAASRTPTPPKETGQAVVVPAKPEMGNTDQEGDGDDVDNENYTYDDSEKM